MKKHAMFVTIIFLAIAGSLAAQSEQNEQITVSGLLDSTVLLRAGAGDAPKFSYGVEEYANIRMQAKLREQAIVYGAFNFIAAAGDSAVIAEQMGGISGTAYAAGENYIATIELERLYFRLIGDVVNFDGGLLRLPFGYGQVWGPSDFLNPKNPLKPDARPRAVLGGGLSWYPIDSLKLLFFGAAPRDPFAQSGNGGRGGLSMDQDWDRASLQLLYAFESPQKGDEQILRPRSRYGIHRAGISVKADVVVGLVMDALYTYNAEAGTKLDGLSFSAGADYSFFDGKLLIIAEYLYNGGSSSTSIKGGGSFSNENYLYTSFTWSFTDFTNLTAALISSFDDVSFTPIISLNHDLFQGATLIVSAQIPLDRDLFAKDGNRGELGPLPPDKLQPLLPLRMGRYFDFNAKIRLRF